jgi:drug/metabolite transporter (DMT)-like permease
MQSEAFISLAVAAAWSVSTIVNKVALKSLSVDLVFALTATVSFLTSWSILLYKRPNVSPLLIELTHKPNFRVVLIVALAFFISIVGRYVFLEVLNKTTRTYMVVTLTNTVPLFVAVASWALLREEFTSLSVAGLLLTTIGVILLSVAMKRR